MLNFLESIKNKKSSLTSNIIENAKIAANFNLEENKFVEEDVKKFKKNYRFTNYDGHLLLKEEISKYSCNTSLLKKKTKLKRNKLSTNSNTIYDEEGITKKNLKIKFSNKQSTAETHLLNTKIANLSNKSKRELIKYDFNFINDSIFDINSTDSNFDLDKSIQDIKNRLKGLIPIKHKKEFFEYFRDRKSFVKFILQDQDEFLSKSLEKMKFIIKNNLNEDEISENILGEMSAYDLNSNMNKITNYKNNEETVPNTKPLFFVFDKKNKKNIKLINSVPYVCPFFNCSRQFFNINNWEKHIVNH